MAQPETDKLQQQRLERLQKITAMGIDPYGGRFDGSEPAAAAKDRFEKDPSEGQKACVAGRIVLLRDIGKLMFLTLRDSSGTIQLGFSKSLLADKWEFLKLLELGDIIAVRGGLGRTKTGEITIWAEDVTLLCKCLLQPPEKFHGLADVELRYRQRYVDLWANPEVMQRFRKRIAIVQDIRDFLNSCGFLEVETPMMQTIPGGAAAKPFITHHNSLDMDLFLRIAPELFLKRLLVGGMEKVFEINRNFRNEGLSPRHNPEFTMLELYQAYADYNIMMDMCEELLSGLVEKHCESNVVRFGEYSINFQRPWRRAKYADLLKQYSGCDIGDINALRNKAAALGLNITGVDDAVVIQEVFEATVEHNLVDPIFVMDYPVGLCPLTKRSRTDANYAERFELYAATIELANAYTELNDPQVQLDNFARQLKGANEEEQAFRTMDEDFITALKYGMPPAGGMGIGIDRLVMVLTGATTIRDVILFPLLRPEKKE